jgi:hypothetical protein
VAGFANRADIRTFGAREIRAWAASVKTEGSTETIPVLLCVDVEPDEFYVDRRNRAPWRGFEAVHPMFGELRARLEEKTGRDVHFTWAVRMDPQVAVSYGRSAWAVERYSSYFEEYRRAGDEIGSHVHTYRWSQAVDDWIDDYADDAWVRECLEMSANGHEEIFGEKSRTVRFGVFWASTAAINHAEELGYRYDLTVEPGLPANVHDARKPDPTGVQPSYYRVPREPYIPSRSDFRERADGERRDLTVIPLTSGYKKLGLGLRSTRERLDRLMNNGLRHRRMSTPLSMWKGWDGANSFGDMLDRAIEAQQKPYLAFTLHSNFPVTKSDSKVRASIEALVDHPACSRFAFCTPAELLSLRR